MMPSTADSMIDRHCRSLGCDRSVIALGDVLQDEGAADDVIARPGNRCRGQQEVDKPPANEGRRQRGCCTVLCRQAQP
jgi:hypothetical protein